MHVVREINNPDTFKYVNSAMEKNLIRDRKKEG